MVSKSRVGQWIAESSPNRTSNEDVEEKISEKKVQKEKRKEVDEKHFQIIVMIK
jgi:hypothetical protein